MWICVSVLNIIFANIAEKNYIVNRTISKLSLLFIVVINIIVFGLRDIGVGTDTLVYIDIYFYIASSLESIYDIAFFSNFDKGYMLFAYIASSFGNDSRLLLFFTELFIITFMTLGLFELKKTLKYNITWFMLFFIFLYQRETINLMRQFCAMSLLFYGYSLYLQKKNVHYFVCQILAYFFHSSSVIFIIVPLTHFVSQMDTRIKFLYLGLGAFVLMIFVFLFHHILPIINTLGLLRESYFDSYGASSSIEGLELFSLHFVIRSAFFSLQLFICYILRKKQYISDSCIYMIITMCTFNYLLNYAAINIKYFERIAYYFGLIMIVYLSSLISIKNDNIRRLIYIYAFCLFVMMFRVFYTNANEIIDNQKNRYHLIYSSEILGITTST